MCAFTFVAISNIYCEKGLQTKKKLSKCTRMRDKEVYHMTQLSENDFLSRSLSLFFSFYTRLVYFDI